MNGHLYIVKLKAPYIYVCTPNIHVPFCVQPHVIGEYISEPAHMNELHAS